MNIIFLSIGFVLGLLAFPVLFFGFVLLWDEWGCWRAQLKARRYVKGAG